MAKFLPPRATTAIRTAHTPLKGELLFDTDLDKLFIGDGVTVGGIEVGTGSGGGGEYIIQDEGVDLAQRAKLNFVGSGVVVTDDSAGDRSIVTINSPDLTGKMDKSVYDTDNDGIVDEADVAGLADLATAIVGNPDPLNYYGTDNTGTKGFFTLPTGTGGGGLGFAYHNTNFTGTVNALHAVDTLSTAITATLPTTPANGTIVSFYDYRSNFGTNALTIIKGGADTILGGTQLILNSSNATVQLIYYDGRWSVFGTEVFVDTVNITPIDEVNISYIVAGAVG